MHVSFIPAGSLLAHCADTPAHAVLCCAVLCCLQRYRALFALRNKGGEAAVAVLGEAFGASSALLKHEVAYVMGQMQHPASADTLCKVLQVRSMLRQGVERLTE
jgi:hypothetical protein